MTGTSALDLVLLIGAAVACSIFEAFTGDLWWRGYGLAPHIRQRPETVRDVTTIFEWGVKAIAFFCWIAVWNVVHDDGSSLALTVLACVLFAAGMWLALFGQHALVRWYRNRRVRRAVELGTGLQFKATITPRSAVDDKDIWLTAEPGRLLLATDRSLPKTFQRELAGEIDPKSIRRTEPAEAPGHRRWLSVTLNGSRDDYLISTNPEYMKVLVARSPYGRSSQANGVRSPVP